LVQFVAQFVVIKSQHAKLK